MDGRLVNDFSEFDTVELRNNCELDMKKYEAPLETS